MRVLHILASRGPGGAEALVRYLAVEHVRRGDSVAIAFISRAEQVGNSSYFEKLYQEELDKAGVRTFDIGHHARKSPIFGSWRLRKIIAEYRPDVLHVHVLMGLLFNTMLWPQRISTIYTHHTNHLKVSSPIFRLLTAAAECCIAISEQARDLLERSTSTPVSLIQNAVGSGYAVVGKGTTRSTQRRVISVGRLYPAKDYATLIDVAARIFASRPELTGRLVFQVAGEGPERPVLEHRIKSAGLEDKVSLLGLRTDIAELLTASNLFLMTSRWEGLPISLIEASRAGLPLVATDVGGCSEVVKHGRNGFLAAPGDVEALAAHVVQILDNEEMATEFGLISEKISRRFSIEVCLDRHLELYSNIVK